MTQCLGLYRVSSRLDVPHRAAECAHPLARANWPHSCSSSGMPLMPRTPFRCTHAAPLLLDSTQLRPALLEDWAFTLGSAASHPHCKEESILCGPKLVFNLYWNGRHQGWAQILWSYTGCSKGRWAHVPGECQSRPPGALSHITASGRQCFWYKVQQHFRWFTAGDCSFGGWLVFSFSKCQICCCIRHVL